MQVSPGTTQALETANPELLLGSVRVLSLVRSIRLMHAPLREPVGCYTRYTSFEFYLSVFWFYVFATLTDNDTDLVSINVFFMYIV